MSLSNKASFIGTGDSILDSVPPVAMAIGGPGLAYVATNDPVLSVFAGAAMWHFDVGGSGTWAAETLGIDIRKQEEGSGDPVTVDPPPVVDPPIEPPVTNPRLTPQDVVDAESCYNFIVQETEADGASTWGGGASVGTHIIFEVSNRFVDDAITVRLKFKHPTKDEYYLAGIGGFYQLISALGIDYLVVDGTGLLLYPSSYGGSWSLYGYADPASMIVNIFGGGIDPTTTTFEITKPSDDSGGGGGGDDGGGGSDGGGGDPDPDPPAPPPPVYETAEDCINYYLGLGRKPGRSVSAYDPISETRLVVSAFGESYDPNRRAVFQVKHPHENLWFDVNYGDYVTLLGLYLDLHMSVENDTTRKLSQSEANELCLMTYNTNLINFLVDQSDFTDVLIASDTSVLFDKWYDMESLNDGSIPRTAPSNFSTYLPGGVTVVGKQLDEMCTEWTTDRGSNCAETRECYVSGEMKIVEGTWPYAMREQAWEQPAISAARICEILWGGGYFHSHASHYYLPLGDLHLASTFNMALFGSSPTYRRESVNNVAYEVIGSYTRHFYRQIPNCRED